MNEDNKNSHPNTLKMQVSPRRDKPQSLKPSTPTKRTKKDILLSSPAKEVTHLKSAPIKIDDDIDNVDSKNENITIQKNKPNGKRRVPMKRNHSEVNISSSRFDLNPTNSATAVNKNEFEQRIQTNHDNLSPGVAIGRDGKTPVSSSFAKQKYKDMLTPYEMSEINEYPNIFFVGNSIAKKNLKGSFDNENTFQYNAKVGDHIAYRYRILAILGKGAFGTVLKCLDHKTKYKVAIKILVNTPVMQSQGQIEVDNIKLLTQDNITEEIKSKEIPWRAVHSSVQSPTITKSKRSSSIDDALSPPKNKPNNEFAFPSNTDSHQQPKNLSMKHVIQMTDNFIFRNHICIVTEILGESIYDFMKRRTKSKTPRSKKPPIDNSNSNKAASQQQPQQPEQLDPLPPQMVKIIAYQIMDGLASIHRKKIIHGDLKPENILFTLPDSDKPVKKPTRPKSKAASKLSNSSKVSSPFSSPYQSPRTISHFNTSFSVIDNLTVNSQIKIIDLGSSCRQGELIYNYIQSRFYRAPEVVLGAYYGPGIDVWSAGCNIAELFVGRPLFPATSEADLLFRFIETLGTPPTSVIQMQSDFVAKITRNAKNKTATTKQKQNAATNAPRNKFFSDDGRLLNVANQPVPMKTRLSSFLKSSDALMIDFLSKCLEWDKDKRLSAVKLCKHPWISSFAPQKNL